MVVELSAAPLGGATAADYRLSPARAVFAPGQTVATVEVSAVDDGDDDDGEGVALGFAALPDGVAAAQPFEASVSIADDDTALKAVAARFSASSYTAVEGGAAAGVEVVLSADPERMVVVELSAAPVGGAAAADYRLSSTQAVFAAGQTVARVEVSAVDDGDDDDGEGVAVGFAALPDGVTAGRPFEASVSIIDNDEHGPAPPQGLRTEARSNPLDALGAVVWVLWDRPADASGVAGYVLEWRADGDSYSAERRLRLAAGRDGATAVWGADASHWLRVAAVGAGAQQSAWAEIGPVAMVAPGFFWVRERWEGELEFTVAGEPRRNAELITGYTADIRAAATDTEPTPGPWTPMEVTAFSTRSYGGRTRHRAHAGGLEFGVPYELRAAPLTAAGEGAFELRLHGVLRMPCPPANVRAVAGVRSVEASWDPPSCTGSFPLASYYTGLLAGSATWRPRAVADHRHHRQLRDDPVDQQKHERGGGGRRRQRQQGRGVAVRRRRCPRPPARFAASPRTPPATAASPCPGTRPQTTATPRCATTGCHGPRRTPRTPTATEPTRAQ